MKNKTITANSANTVNPWEEHSIANRLFEEVKSGFENFKGLNENWFWEEGNVKFYLLCPSSIKGREYYLADNFHHAYSMIFGYFVIDDGLKRYKFYADENTFLDILDNIYMYSDRESCEQDSYALMWQHAKALITFKIVDHFKKEYNVENGFCCKECTCRMDENSFSEILDSNPGIIHFTNEKYLNCPICGSEIPIDENIKDMLCSYETLYNYHCFSKQKFGEEFQLKFIANLLKNKKESEFLKELEMEKISDPLCQELFGISKKEFDSFWYFFRIYIRNKVYDAVKKFIFYEDDPEHFKYLESHRSEALKSWRRKKLNRLVEKRRNENE